MPILEASPGPQEVGTDSMGLLSHSEFQGCKSHTSACSVRSYPPTLTPTPHLLCLSWCPRDSLNATQPLRYQLGPGPA